jgi:thiamine-monophosphate kinase
MPLLANASADALPSGFTLESVSYAPKSRPSRKSLGELLLIERIRSRASTSRAVREGIGDDCAILKPPPGHELLVTTDFSLEGRHFRRDWHSPASVGHRTLARGLSDLAAMGAKPLAAFLSLALPRSLARNTRWLDGFLDGLLSLANTHHVPLAGGDTAESPSNHILADIVLIGSAPAGRALRRSTAHAGDLLYCTGSLGGGAAELAALAASPRKFRNATAAGDHPDLFPQPRLAVGAALLRRRLATSCIDISDGLSTDLTHLCQESNVAAEIDAASLPIHPLAQLLGPDHALHAALHGGEDYELLFTAPPTAKLPRSIAGVRITQIGRIVTARKPRPQITLIDREGHRSALTPHGWEHFV